MFHRTVRIVLPIFIVLASVYLLIRAVLIQAQPSTFLLSDHTVTGENTGAWTELAAVTTGNKAHIVWDEATETNEHEDLFYRQLPYGFAQNISDPDLTEGGINFVALDSATNEDVCAVWREEAAGAEGTNLYFWRLTDGETLELTENDLTSDDVEDVQFICLDDEAHVIWLEDEELFYWQESTQLTSILSNPAESVGVVARAKLVEEQGTAYVAWSEWIGNSSSGIFHPFYWDSKTDTVLDLGPGTPEDLYLFVDSNEIAHLVWLEVVGNPSTDRCVMYWNSQDKTEVNISQNPAQCETLFLSAEMAENKDIHATWVHKPDSSLNDEIIYWNTQLSTSSVITSVNTIYQYLELLIDHNGTAYIAWKASPGTDLYYWDSSAQAVKNISDPVAGEGDVISTEKWLEWAVDETNNVHFLWAEENCSSCSAKSWLFYHNVNEGNTVRLFNPAGDEDNVLKYILEIASPGTAHVAWVERISNGLNDELISYWDSTSQNLQEIGSEGDVDELQLAKPFAGPTMLAWLTFKSGAEQNNVYTWNETEGITELTDEAATEGVAKGMLLLGHGLENYYVLWAEETESMGDDMFGAWEEISLPNQVYLPIIAR